VRLDQSGHVLAIDCMIGLKAGTLKASSTAFSAFAGILEDQDGHCWVALHYFWRWVSAGVRGWVGGELWIAQLMPMRKGSADARV